MSFKQLNKTTFKQYFKKTVEKISFFLGWIRSLDFFNMFLQETSLIRKPPILSIALSSSFFFFRIAGEILVASAKEPL